MLSLAERPDADEDEDEDADEDAGARLNRWVELITRIVPDSERMTMDSVLQPPPKKRTPLRK